MRHEEQAVAGRPSPAWSRWASRRAAQAQDQGKGQGEVLRHRQGGPERLRHRHAHLRRQGEEGQPARRMEVRSQGHLREARRQDQSRQVTHPHPGASMKTSKALVSSALAGLLAAGLASTRPPRPARARSATASPRRGRTTAARPRIPARARRPRTTTRRNGSTVAKGTCEKMGGKLTAAAGDARRRCRQSPTSRRAANARGARARATPASGCAPRTTPSSARRQPRARVPRGPQRELLRRRRRGRSPGSSASAPTIR